MTTYENNFGTVLNVAYALNTKVPIPGAGTTVPYKIPVGYLLSAPPTGVTDNGDGTFTVDETYVSAPIEFTSAGNVGHEVTDGPGGTITANTVDQTAL